MVAFMCNENKTPCFLASAISVSKKFNNGDPVAIKGVTYQYGENVLIKIDNITRSN